MHHTTKFLSKIIGIFTACFLVFAPNVASAAMPTAQQIYDFYVAGGPNCWAGDAENFCSNWTGCSAYGWWEYRWAFCDDGDDLTVEVYPSGASVRAPADVADELGISYGSIDFSSFEPDQIIRNGESDNYSDTDLKCTILFHLYERGAYPLINMYGPNYGWQNDIVWWNGETVTDPLVGWALSYYAYDIYDAIQYAHQQTGTQFPSNIETHANYAQSRLGIDCGSNWDSITARSESEYQMSCTDFNEIWDYAINLQCPSSATDTGGWIMSMYPDNSYSSSTLATMYKNTFLYNAFCEQCSESLWGTSGCSQYDIAKTATVQNVDTCNFDKGGTNGYVITYDLQGGSWGATPTTQTVTYGSSWSIIFDSYPSKSGYTFGGFYTSANCGGTKYVNAGSSSDWQLTSARNWDKTSNTTLYACWRSNTTYTITYNMQGGSWGSTPTTQTVTYGSSWSIILDSYPSKSGYEFGGFYTSTNCGGTKYVNAGSSSDWQLTSARNWDKTSNTTLYACWKSNATYSLNYSSISDAMTQAEEDGYLNCYGNQNGDGPILVRCDCRTSVADLTGEPEFMYEIEMPSYAQTNCPTSGVPESAMTGLSCSLSGTFGDYSQGRLLCVSQDLLGGDNCSDICGCGNPWSGDILSSQQIFYGDGTDCTTDASDDTWCIKTSSDTSYLYREISLDDPEYMFGCYANETVLYGCAANMYYDNSGNADDGAWCSNCPSYTLADGTTAPGSLAALTSNPTITQCTVPTTSILRGTNGNYKYRNACAYTE